MRALTIEDLNAAAHVGGAGSLTMRQELEPASGPDGVIAPAKYVDDRGNATYIFRLVFIRAVILVADRKSFLHFAACILRLFRWHT